MKNSQNQTPIFVIGAMKAGTTTIYNYLRLNSEICFPVKKEPSYFCDTMGNKEFKSGDFFDLYDLRDSHRFFYDGSTNYTKYPAEKNVPQNIFEYGLRPKFIYVVRNPFERIESHFNYTKQHPQWKKMKITSHYLIDISNYFLQLKHFEQYFKKNDFLIIDFDDLKRDHHTILKRIHQFIGLSEIPIPEQDLHANKTKEVNRTEVRLRKKIDGKLNFLPQGLKAFAKRLFGLFFPAKKSVLTKKQKEFIHTKLLSDMQNFGREYNFDVKKWGF